MLPERFLERMQEMLGEEYDAFLEALGGERYQALRLNPLKVGADGRSAAETLGAAAASGEGETGAATASEEGELTAAAASGEGKTAAEESRPEGGREVFAHLTKVPWAENGYYYDADDRPGKHPYHDAGLYYIQEPTAMAPAELLMVRPGQRVLDLCAAPGGKSTQIAAKLQGQGLLICNEIHPARAKSLSENIERMGICNACVTNEPPERMADFFPEYFDRILVDAPCSGEGMFRKNDAACGEWSPENVAMCAERQDGILDCAAGMLRPGGRLVYSTCTFAREEDEGSVERFLGRHEDFSLVRAEDGSGPEDWPAAEERGPESGPETGSGPGGKAAYGKGGLLPGTLRLWPHRVKGEGHFAAVLQKAGDLPEGCLRKALGGTVKGLSEKELRELPDFERFCRETLSGGSNGSPAFLAKAAGMRGDGVYIRFGDNLYLVPADMPSLRGLKVLRPGLQIGELKKNRFEPSHALVLALRPEYASNIWNMASGDERLRYYLQGGAFSAEGEKGWHLICVDGFGIGWGKLAGGVMKNHYPKGLRRNQ